MNDFQIPDTICWSTWSPALKDKKYNLLFAFCADTQNDKLAILGSLHLWTSYARHNSKSIIRSWSMQISTYSSTLQLILLRGRWHPFKRMLTSLTASNEGIRPLPCASYILQQRQQRRHLFSDILFALEEILLLWTHRQLDNHKQQDTELTTYKWSRNKAYFKLLIPNVQDHQGGIEIKTKSIESVISILYTCHCEECIGRRLGPV